VQAPPVPTGPVATWKFQASLFNVTLAATAESAQNQPSECPQCSSGQAAQNVAELAKKLLIADKSQARGTIELTTTPGEVSVILDGVELVQNTPDGEPLVIKTFTGKHTLKLRKTDYWLEDQKVTVSDGGPTALKLQLKPGEPPKEVVYVPTEVVQRPAWRIGLGIGAVAIGAALIGYGGIVASVDGQAVLMDGKEDFTRVYDTKTKGIAFIVPGAAFLIGGVVLMALPGDKKKTSDGKSLASVLSSVSVGAVGSGTGLVVQGRY